MRISDWSSDVCSSDLLQGPHNAQNVAATIAVARALGVDDEAVARGLETYPGLPHRMERVAERNGVLFVNDSNAINPTSTAHALAAYPAVYWILGGLADRKCTRLNSSHYCASRMPSS